MNAEQTLSYLEKIESTNESWREYVHKRAVEVQRWIYSLQVRAGKKPTSRVAGILTAKADELQRRLDTVLSRFVDSDDKEDAS